ncbi:hypothetical protein [Stagnihabitans tardus]|uniref:Ferrochelatase n=1 Tax=Stagnihabitans tardus TaxID=2699202 RepID=A0AAE5BVQ9_9RHOB|nr:hypothetical protein [Stagnihabitans tardus]NBZ87498.1 hypothetical protein [Stagnihabitans tardus]
MRKIALALTLAASLAPAATLAGGVPEVEPVVVCGDCGAPSSSSGGLIVPLLLLLVIGAAVAN